MEIADTTKVWNFTWISMIKFFNDFDRCWNCPETEIWEIEIIGSYWKKKYIFIISFSKW